MYDVVYKTSNSKVVYITKEGKARANKAGKLKKTSSCTVTATITNKETKKKEVLTANVIVVLNGAVGVKISNAQIANEAMQVGDTLDLNSNLLNKKGNKISNKKPGLYLGWFTSDEAIASVKLSNGVVTARRAGEVTITVATFKNAADRKAGLSKAIATDSVTITVVDPEVVDIGNTTMRLGMSIQELYETMGDSAYTVPAEYTDCEWYVFNSDYTCLTFALVKEDKVVGIFTDGAEFLYKDVGSGMSAIVLEENGFLLSGENYFKTTDTVQVEYYIDHLAGGVISGVLVMEKAVYKTENRNGCENSWERLIFEITNSFRAKNNFPIFTWEAAVAEVARKHAMDMAEQDYFAHKSLDGRTPGDRLEADGLNWKAYAENIAAGYSNAITATYGWINSKGHRENLLSSSVKTLGVGVFRGGSYGVYYVQNFYTPW